MNTEQMIINDLISNVKVHIIIKGLNKTGGCYIAGGAITSIITGNKDKIADYDIYFKDKKSCSEAIHYMKEHNWHICGITDKSITYKIIDNHEETVIQFIFYDFYEKPEDIFAHYDFTINMAAYDSLTNELTVHDKFWLHNSQRFLEINHKTKFPILTMLRIEKYKDRGYTTSKRQMIKLALAVNDLNIDSWGGFIKQVGSLYGFQTVKLRETKEPFSVDLAVELMEDIEPNQDPEYLYDPVLLGFIVAEEPIKYVKIGEEKQYIINADVDDETLAKAVEDGILTDEEISLETATEGKEYYFIKSSEAVVGNVIRGNHEAATDKEGVNQATFKDYVICKVSYVEEDIKYVYIDCVSAKNYKIEEVCCWGSEYYKWLASGKSIYKPRTVMSTDRIDFSISSSDDNEQNYITKQLLKLKWGPILKECVVVTNSGSGYAHKTKRGFILKGGEYIPDNVLKLYLDDWNFCFGGSGGISSDGSFIIKIHTD